MQISSDCATQHAGRDINSHNTLSFQGTHLHAHHHYPSRSSTAKAQLRCPLPSHKFVGRKDELRRLKEFFTSSGPDQKKFALIGMGGCGKSQIASKFIHGHILKEKIYDPSRVFFVDATSLAKLEQSYASIAQSNGVGSAPQDALLWLSNTEEPCFVLIDNVDNPDLDLAAYTPRSMNVHVLITTRLRDKGRLHASTPDAFIDIDGLPRQDAEELLVQTAMLQPGVSKDVSVLVEELHCHALAVAQAGACIAFLHLTVDKYLKRFRRLGTGLMDGKNDGVNSSALYGYPKVMRSTWKLSYDQLPEPSKDLFNLCAFLHHTGITQTLFHKATEALGTYSPTMSFSPTERAAFAAVKKALKSFQEEDGSFDDFAFARCIGPILSLSLMRYDPITGVYSIHPPVLDSLQRLISDHLPTSLLLMLSITSDEVDIPYLYQILPHVDSLMGLFTAVQGSSEQAQCVPDMAMAFSFVHIEIGQWDAAESLLRACIAGRTTGLGRTHEHTLQAATYLSFVLRKSGQLEAAEILGRSLLADWTHKRWEDHLSSKRGLTQSETTISALRQYNEAKQAQMDVLSRHRCLSDEDHPDMVSAMNNLANTWSDLGRYEEAEKMQLDVLSRCRRLLGEDHPDLTWAMYNLASTWSDLGRYDEAEEILLDIVARRRRLLGEDHPHTVMAMRSLACTWSKLEKWDEIERLQVEVLGRQKRALSEDHPDTVQIMVNLVITLAHLQRHRQAKRLFEEGLQRQRCILGVDDPTTAHSVDSLAWISTHQEAFKRAKELARIGILTKKRVSR